MEEKNGGFSDDEQDLQQENISKDLMFKFAIYEEQIRQIQEQNAALEKALVDSKLLLEGLEALKDAKDKEIFASIGKGIFIKSVITDKDLLVDIGGKNFVKKTVSETQTIIGEQIKKLEKVKEQLQENLDKINEEVDKLIREIQA